MDAATFAALDDLRVQLAEALGALRRSQTRAHLERVAVVADRIRDLALDAVREMR